MKPTSILVDSSIIIDHLRQKDKQKTRFLKLTMAGNLAKLSIVTHTELYAGKSIWENLEARKTLENLLTGCQIVSLTEKASKLAGKLRAELNLPIMDAIIAATAISEKLPLATLNLKHFENIKGLKILPTADR